MATWPALLLLTTKKVSRIPHSMGEEDGAEPSKSDPEKNTMNVCGVVFMYVGVFYCIKHNSNGIPFSLFNICIGG